MIRVRIEMMSYDIENDTRTLSVLYITDVGRSHRIRSCAGRLLDVEHEQQTHACTITH